MLYRFAWVMMWVTFRIFFRKIEAVGREKLSNSEPAILIANHPASFLDAMVLAVFLRRSIHFYVRGDIFSHPLAYRILTLLHMIPIFSREHGTSNLSRNNRTFERGRDLLSSGKLLLIFPEGFSRLSKELVPLKKGAARVALQTAFGDGAVRPLIIQTVAIDYSFHGYGAQLFIRVGDSMNLTSYEQEYRHQPSVCINHLTRDMQQLFQQNVIHLKDGERTVVAERFMRLIHAVHNVWGESYFLTMQSVCHTIDALNEQEWSHAVENMASYEAALSSFGLSDASVAQLGTAHSMDYLRAIIFMVPGLIGGMLWGLPEHLSKWIANKTVTRIDFYTSVHTAVLGVLGLLWCSALALLLYRMGVGWFALLGYASPLFFYCYRQFMLNWTEINTTMRVRKLIRSNDQGFASLSNDQRALIQLFSLQ
ncbi:MAG: 1-acyl-sn-glycerol-3-phosphate acyltransferase [Bacteroidota bacterium]